ncbi:MAG: hypothetical protein ACLRMZ_15415 [Blautia marasmi]
MYAHEDILPDHFSHVYEFHPDRGYYAGVFTWNDFINAYTFTRSTDMKTVTLGLNDFVGFMGTTDWGATFAAITVTVLPTFLFYFFTNKYMLSGLTAGAVKG